MNLLHLTCFHLVAAIFFFTVVHLYWNPANNIFVFPQMFIALLLYCIICSMSFVVRFKIPVMILSGQVFLSCTLGLSH